MGCLDLFQIKGKTAVVTGASSGLGKYACMCYACLLYTSILHKYPPEMSGGQKQRIAAARAMVTEPSLVLADEPTGALDSKAARTMLESFAGMNKRLRATILMVTHDAFAASYCSRILFLRDGKIFTELLRGGQTRRQFFDKIIDVVSLLGGDVADAV